MGCHSFLLRIFLTQGSKLCFLHCRQILPIWATREVHSSYTTNWGGTMWQRRFILLLRCTARLYIPPCLADMTTWLTLCATPQPYAKCQPSPIQFPCSVLKVALTPPYLAHLQIISLSWRPALHTSTPTMVTAGPHNQPYWRAILLTSTPTVVVTRSQTVGMGPTSLQGHCSSYQAMQNAFRNCGPITTGRHASIHKDTPRAPGPDDQGELFHWDSLDTCGLHNTTFSRPSAISDIPHT